MRAERITVAGGQSVLGALSTPEVTSGRVPIKVTAVGPNPLGGAIGPGLTTGRLGGEYPPVIGHRRAHRASAGAAAEGLAAIAAGKARGKIVVTSTD